MRISTSLGLRDGAASVTRSSLVGVSPVLRRKAFCHCTMDCLALGIRNLMCALGKQDLALGWRRRDTARDRPRSLAELMQFRSDLVSEPLKAARIAQSPGYKVGRVGTLLVLNNTYGSATLPLSKKTAVTGLTRSPSELAQ